MATAGAGRDLDLEKPISFPNGWRWPHGLMRPGGEILNEGIESMRVDGLDGGILPI